MKSLILSNEPVCTLQHVRQKLAIVKKKNVGKYVRYDIRNVCSAQALICQQSMAYMSSYRLTKFFKTDRFRIKII